MISFLTSKNKNEHFKNVFSFCKRNYKDEPIFQNYDVIDWENKPYTLLYLLYKEKRFDECGYGVYIKDKEIIAGSGMYRSEIHPDIFVFACRTLKDNDYKGYDKTIIRDIWLEQVKILKEKKALGIIITYDINKEKRMFELFEKDSKLLKRSRLINNGIPELQNLEILDTPITIKGTVQRIIYKFFDENMKWDKIPVKN